jgi:hypothetical protein
MKFSEKPTPEEIQKLQDDGEIVYHYEAESGLGKYEAYLTLPDAQTQDYILKQIGTDKFMAAVDSTKDKVVLWCNKLTNKSLIGLIGAYSDFFQKASPSNFTPQSNLYGG